jgi:integrase
LSLSLPVLSAVVLTLSRFGSSGQCDGLIRSVRDKGVFGRAGIPGDHAHRSRDTFAAGLLQAGVPIKRVSVLLSQSSIKVTEKYYAPWVRAR